MKKLSLLIAALMVCLAASAQSPIKKIMERFDDPERGHTAFIEKGSRTMGISGSYRNIRAGGYVDSDGFDVFSLLNMGAGQAHIWTVSPKFNWFLANDFALGLRLDYSGYWIDTDVRLDLREVVGKFFEKTEVVDPSTDEGKAALEALNLTISNRHWHQHSGGVSLTARKYLSFFGSKTFAVFGEGRLFGRFGITTSYPVPDVNEEIKKLRISKNIGVGLKGAVGLAVKLREGSLITASIPIVGLEYSLLLQDKKTTVVKNDARLSSFRVARDLDLIGLQIAYSRVIGPKKKK
jgi:hypothetical protein